MYLKSNITKLLFICIWQLFLSHYGELVTCNSGSGQSMCIEFMPPETSCLLFSNCHVRIVNQIILYYVTYRLFTTQLHLDECYCVNWRIMYKRVTYKSDLIYVILMQFCFLWKLLIIVNNSNLCRIELCKNQVEPYI